MRASLHSSVPREGCPAKSSQKWKEMPQPTSTTTGLRNATIAKEWHPLASLLRPFFPHEAPGEMVTIRRHEKLGVTTAECPTHKPFLPAVDYDDDHDAARAAIPSAHGTMTPQCGASLRTRWRSHLKRVVLCVVAPSTSRALCAHEIPIPKLLWDSAECAC